MQNAFQVKADTVNELRNEIYYNQTEVQRILNKPDGLTHKEVVVKLTLLLKDNVLSANALELLERYLPTPPQKQEATPSVDQPTAAPEEVDGVKKVA